MTFLMDYHVYIVSGIIAAIIPLLLYWYYTLTHDYWKKRGVPYVKPIPFLGTLLENCQKNIEVMECERYEKYGKIYGFFEGKKPQITVAEPELIKNILVRDFQYFVNRRKFDIYDPITSKALTVVQDEDWKRIRTIVSPTFSSGKIKRMIRIIKECSKVVIQIIKMESAKNNSVDVLRIYGAFTMDVIANAAFSVKINSHNDPENIFVKMAQKIFHAPFGLKNVIFVLMPKVLKLFRKTTFDTSANDFFKRTTFEIIEERKKTKSTRDDFLQMLLDTANEAAKEGKLEETTDELTTNYGDAAINRSYFKGSVTKKLSMDELVAQCVIFFIAGYHTTMTSLGVTTHLLARHQHEQDRVFKEICEVLKKTGGELTYESLHELKHLDNCISESIRIYSPFSRIERTADSDYSLGDTGLTIPKGMIVGIPIYAMHRDPKFFPEPEKFIPDRFTAEGREKQIPYSYLPFGAGPRNCLGMRFALMELKVCLVHVFSTFHVQLSKDSKVPLEFIRGLGILSPKPIHLTLTPRTDCPLKK